MEPGSHIGHYRIVSRLGVGGMGEVYLAHDENLERRAAVKILAGGSNNDPDSIRRFTQEAKAAAALNHPNIAHIYDAGQYDGVPFLAMEYVEGSTLNTMVNRLPLPAEDILQVAMQVADALVEAHQKGIVHRDIKPSNLIRSTSRSQVKVLDFGLAKLSAAAKVSFATTVSSGAPTQSEGNSEAKVAVGSLPYMSPEQALAKDVDHRTDIFSLGAVLYELATGRRAFAGHTPAAIFDAILNRAPAAPRMMNPDLPESVDRIIRKCLEKDAAFRYQTAQDLLADLRLAHRDLHAAAPLTAQKPSRRSWMLVTLGAVVVFGSAALGWRAAHPREPVDTAPMRSVPLTSFPGSESQPSFSPDGNQVAFAWNQGKEDDLDIWVKVVEAGMPLQLTKTPALEFSPAWSPDGKYIAFLRQTTDSAGFFLIPALGGLERKLSDASAQRVGVDAPFVTWSPDNKQLVLVDRDGPHSPLSLYVLDIEGNQKKRLTTPPVNTQGDSSPVFSPDGSQVAFVRTTSLAIQDIYLLSMKDGRERRLTNDNRRVYGIAWNAADNRIIYSSARNPVSRLWRISPNGGQPEAVSGLGDQAGYLGISRNGHRLAYSRSVIDTNIWKYEMPDKTVPAPVGQMILPSTRHEQGPRYSPDSSRIAFASNRTGSLEIWVSDKNGEKLNQLTSFNGPPTGSPMWSPDGKFLVFDSRPNSNPDIYIVAADGGLPRRVTSDASQDVVPSWSRDGKSIYFSSNRTGRFEVWKMPVEGGPWVQMSKNGGFHGVESPDGQYVYFARGTNMSGMWRVPAAGGEEEAVVERLRPGYWSYWSFGRDGIFYLDREDVEGGGARYPLRFFQLPGKKDTVVTYLSRRPFNSGLSVAPDGKTFLYAQVDQSETDIMLIDGFR